MNKYHITPLKYPGDSGLACVARVVGLPHDVARRFGVPRGQGSDRRPGFGGMVGVALVVLAVFVTFVLVVLVVVEERELYED